MASSSFRDSMNSLGWSRRDDVPVTTTRQPTGFLSSIQSLNPFGDGGYVQLPTTEGPGAPLPARSRREEEEAWFARESTSHRDTSPWSRALTFHRACVSHRLFMCRVHHAAPVRAGARSTNPPSHPDADLQV